MGVILFGTEDKFVKICEFISLITAIICLFCHVFYIKCSCRCSNCISSSSYFNDFETVCCIINTRYVAWVAIAGGSNRCPNVLSIPHRPPLARAEYYYGTIHHTEMHIFNLKFRKLSMLSLIHI